MTTAAEVRRVARDLAKFNLHGPKRVDETFIERVRVAHTWATTHRGRWRHFTRGTCYGLRHSCEFDTSRAITDKCFAVAAVLAGWEPVRDGLQPTTLKFRRAKAEA